MDLGRVCITVYDTAIEMRDIRNCVIKSTAFPIPSKYTTVSLTKHMHNFALIYSITIQKKVFKRKCFSLK